MPPAIATDASSLWTPLWLSLAVSTLAVIFSLPIAAWLAWLLHGRRGAWASAFESAIMLPLVFPPTVLGFYLLQLFGRHGPLGRLILWLFDATLIFTPAAAVLAATMTAAPILFRALKIEFDSTSPDLIGSARIEGASELAIFFFIRLPLAMRSLFAGVALAFLRALGEFGATLMIAGNIPGRTRTLALAIWNAVENGEYRLAHWLAAVLVILSLGLIALLRLIEGHLIGDR